jgi:hypothetical protein
MNRTILLSGVAGFGMAVLGTMLTLAVALPIVVDAQAARVQAERVTVVGDDGAERIRLSAGPGVGAYVQVLDPDGGVRVGINTGGPAVLGGTQLEASNVAVLDPNGTPRAGIGVGGPQGIDREAGGVFVWDSAGIPAGFLGLGRGPEGGLPLANVLVLNDRLGRGRVVLQVAEDGTPSMRLLDTTGRVTWSAP